MSRPSVIRRWWMHSNLGVAGVAAALTAATFPLLGHPVWPSVPALAACGAFLVYQLDRAICPSPEDRVDQSGRLAWIDAHPWYVLGSTGVAILAGAVLLLFQPFRVWVGAVGLGLIGLGYALREHVESPGGSVLPGISGLRERLEAGKPFLLAGVWAIGVVGLPLLALSAGATPAFPVGASAAIGPAAGDGIAPSAAAALLAYRFGCVLPNLLLADWPDRRGDRAAGRCTPAVRLPEERLVRIARSVLGTTIVGGVAAAALTGVPDVLLVDLVGPAATLGLLRTPLPEERWYYAGVLDLWVGWPAVTVLVAL